MTDRNHGQPLFAVRLRIFWAVVLVASFLSTGTIVDVQVAQALGHSCKLAPHANLVGCHFSKYQLAGKNLNHANLTGVSLPGADLSHTNFAGAILTRANFTGATAQGASFSGATLKGANLSHVSFQASNFTDAKLSGSILTGVHFMYPDNFTGANLS